MLKQQFFFLFYFIKKEHDITSCELHLALDCFLVNALKNGPLILCWKNGSQLKTGSHLESWGKLRKMAHTKKKIGHTWESGSLSEKWVTVGKIGQSGKNESHVGK